MKKREEKNSSGRKKRWERVRSGGEKKEKDKRGNKMKCPPPLPPGGKEGNDCITLPDSDLSIKSIIRFYFDFADRFSAVVYSSELVYLLIKINYGVLNK